MKIHRDNNNNSTCLKDLPGFEGRGGQWSASSTRGGDIPGRYLWPTDGRRWGLRMEARDDGPAGPRIGD